MTNLLILGLIAYGAVVWIAILIIAKVNGWALEREFARHYDSKYGGKGSYKRACKQAVQEQRIKQYSN